MALRYAANTGNWSALATWDGGASLPGAGDDVYANNKTVTIDQDVTVLSLRTTAGGAAVAGGGFAVSTARTITAEIIAGSSSCLSASPGSGVTVNVIGNVTANTSVQGIAAGGAGTLNVVGNVFGASGTYGAGIRTNSLPVLNITGNVTGGTTGTTLAPGVFVDTGAINITGNAYGGTGSHGVAMQGSGTSCNLYGEAVGHPTSGFSGVANTNTGSCFVQVARASDFPNAGSTSMAPGSLQSATGGFITIGAMIFGSGGAVPISGRHFIRNAGTNYVTMRESNEGATLNMGELSADYPTQANVRSGVSFDFGNKTGTCAVPAAGSVAFGVAVDNTTGTAALTPTALLGADLKTRLETCATVQTVGDQLAALGT